MWLEKFSEKPIHFKTWFLFETIRNSSKQYEKHDWTYWKHGRTNTSKKSKWTIKYVVDKILERITLNIHIV